MEGGRKEQVLWRVHRHCRIGPPGFGLIAFLDSVIGTYLPSALQICRYWLGWTVTSVITHNSKGTVACRTVRVSVCHTIKSNSWHPATNHLPQPHSLMHAKCSRWRLPKTREWCICALAIPTAAPSRLHRIELLESCQGSSSISHHC